MIKLVEDINENETYDYSVYFNTSSNYAINFSDPYYDTPDLSELGYHERDLAKYANGDLFDEILINWERVKESVCNRLGISYAKLDYGNFDSDCVSFILETDKPINPKDTADVFLDEFSNVYGQNIETTEYEYGPMIYDRYRETPPESKYSKEIEIETITDIEDIEVEEY